MAVEKPEERLAKFSVHETVRDGIAAAGYVGEQLHEADAGATYDRVHEVRREKVPRIDYVQRRPADEELQDYHEEHPDHLQHPAWKHSIRGVLSRRRFQLEFIFRRRVVLFRPRIVI